MQKQFPFFLLLLLLFGCSIPVPAPTAPLAGHTGNYETDVQITMGNFRAAATVSQASPEACVITFTFPPSLAGMEYAFLGDSIDVAYKGLSFQFDPCSLPAGAPALILTQALAAAFQDPDLPVDETGAALQGNLAIGEFTLLLDENNTPAKLFVPAANLEIELQNFRFHD